MIQTFFTASGSVYEVNTLFKKIRRLDGSQEPTPRQGQDEQWKYYEEISEIKVNSPVLISWSFNEDASVIEGTMTSPVVEVF